MLAIMLVLVMAINGGLYVGTILHSATQMAKFDQVADFYQKLWG